MARLRTIDRFPPPSADEVRTAVGDALLLTVPQAARLCNIGRSVAYEMCQTGAWRCMRISPKLLRVPVSSLLEWIDAGTAAPNGAAPKKARVDRIAA